MNIPPIHSKLPDAGTTIFTVMSRLASEHGAINLGQGFPDYPMSAALVSEVNNAMQKGFNQYVPMQGYMPLRESIAEKVAFLYSTVIDPESQITVTPGGTYAIYTALTTILQPGDEVILFEPAYDSYIPNIEINGGIPVRIQLKFPGYKIDWEEVRQKISPRTRAIIINTPHNPSGSVLDANDIEALRQIVQNSGIFIISDEVYEHIIFDGLQHESILKYPDLLQRSFVCFSFGKTYNCTGWKLGYCISAVTTMTEFRKVHQYNCFSCNSPVQVALASFLKNRNEYLGLGAQLQERRDRFKELMKNSRFDLLPSYGSYFICAGYDRISDEDDYDFCVRLTREHGVAAIPLSSFYKDATDNKVIRFCFSKKDETLKAAADRLAKV